MEQKIAKFIEYIKESNNIVFFGGAGVSTESGIPDFRSKDGLYNQHDVRFDKFSPEYLLSRDCLYDNPKVFYEFYRQKMDARDCKPNTTHNVLAKLEKLGKLKAVVTQNIDGLHQDAGSINVYEIHGTTRKNYCNRCNKIYDSNYIFDCDDAVPNCECGGMIRPYVTLYGEGLPDDAVRGALNAIRNADMLIIAGTSLTVYPASGFINYFSGEHLVVINKEELKVPINKDSDIFICDAAGKVFNEVDKEIN